MSIIEEYKSICNQIDDAELLQDNSVSISALYAEKASMKEVLMNRYRVVLSTLCGYLGIINRYAQDFEEAGKTPKNNVLAELSIRLAGLKDELLDLKDVLELPCGLSFMEDNCFDGFEIKDGRFVGQKDNVKLILRKWMEGFPEKANTYQYEVAVFVYFLAFPECFDTEETVKVRKPLFKLVGRRFFKWQKKSVIKLS